MMKNIKLIFGFSAVLLFLAGLSLNLWNDSRDINRRLKEAEVTIKTMKQEHDKAMQTASAAMRAREVEHERYERKIAEAERILEGNADFGDIVLPDDVARLLRKANGATDPECGLPPAGDPAR